MSKKVSKNNSKTTWILKCDIVKFFANIDHRILKKILEKYIYDEDVMWLLGLVVDSFETQGKPGVGLPLGNLTSQLLVNIYMNEFDQFIKRKLKIKYYIRYADDFVILSEDKKFLTGTILDISEFLDSRLHLCLHPNKVLIRTLASGVDFLGWTHFPHHRTLRKSTKRKMLRKLKCGTTKAILNSYLGLLSHGNTYKLAKLITKDQ
jgi:hypothetical protein